MSALRVLIMAMPMIFHPAAEVAYAEGPADPALTVRADDDEQWLSEMLQVLDETTEIATKSRLNADYVPGTVTVLHGRDVEALGMRTVGEALALIPGVMSHRGARGELSAVVRGLSWPFNSNNVKVLLNGIPMSRDVSGLTSAALSLPMEQVERIELIRGPGSVLYGDYALSGVLNILTRHDGSKAFTRVDQHGTTTLGGHTTVGSSEHTPRLSVNVAGLTGHDVEAPDDDSAQNDQRFGVVTLRHHGFKLIGQALYDDYQQDQGLYRQERSQALELRQTVSLQLDTTAQFYLSYLHNDVQSDFGYLLGDTWEGGTTLSWQGMENHEWQVEFSYTSNRIDDAEVVARPLSPEPIRVQNKTRRYYGLSLQDRVTLSDRGVITAGVRLDRRDDLNRTVMSPRVAAVWQVAEHHLVKAQYAEGYRAPTFFEASLSRRPLKPETVATSEFSYIYRIPNRLVRITLFDSRFEDHIAVDTDLLPDVTYTNRGTSRATGAELEWEQQWSSQLTSHVSLSYADTHDGRAFVNENNEDPTTTDWLGNVALFYRPNAQRLFTAHWNVIGTRHTTVVETDVEHRVALTGSFFNVVPGLTVRFGIQNLLGAQQRYLRRSPEEVTVTDFSERLLWGQLSYEF